ncbi:hypothetical protein U3A58_08700 [Algoriphagus sp. C2-6-M1]|uniref:hypothetical protein n=1 Tax=Algoriphagus persicinus TaxID=3108754 RepID=UPI002B3733AD|nr:hypothetical protein [Algoriphagus sp. C2-6-M1]MEB2780470.1 hypothetical protein [Algoriphagus sp. C2-6-M1]
MKNLIKYLFLFSLWSCDETFPHETGRFPDEQAINLVDLNSEYDEMNSNFVPTTADLILTIIYSTNSISNGQQFDLDYSRIFLQWNKETGNLAFYANRVFDGSQAVRNLLFQINSNRDEKGPYSFVDESKGVILFSRDNSEGFFSICFDSRNNSGQGVDEADASFRLLDEDSNEMYPSFFGTNFLKGAIDNNQGKPEKMLFSSDRDGTFDIYELDLSTEGSVIAFLQSSQEKDIKKIKTNTTFNDHMPFVYGDLLVFSSDRAGGFGGYDLYYSHKTGDGWSEPVNFGPKINSEFDEFRPIVSDSWEFSNQVMIFSSNRPGGLGGFDLYFVGIPKF